MLNTSDPNNHPFKVAMIARPNLYLVPGGDTIQIKETAQGLKQLNIEVEIILSSEIDYSKYQLLHFFNIIDPEDILGHVYKCSLPYVVSTIYVDYSEYDKHHRKGILGILSKFLPYHSIEYLKTLAKFLLKGEKVSTIRYFLVGNKKSILYILNRAHILLPNSENEFKRLSNDFKFSQLHKVVPNGYNPDIFKVNEGVKRDIILCVGRLEGNKNQLNVIRALKNTNFNIVFIGAASKNQANYVKACKEEAGENMTFIDHINQTELISYYNRAKVHVLASWFETTGLSSLEAGAMGCNLVVANRGDVKDYFKDYVFYCEPDDINSIKENIVKAWDSPAPVALQKYIFDNFTWYEAAKKTLEAYRQILDL